MNLVTKKETETGEDQGRLANDQEAETGTAAEDPDREIGHQGNDPEAGHRKNHEQRKGPTSIGTSLPQAMSM